MNEYARTKAPGWFWVGAAILLLWNLIGVGACMMQLSMSGAELAALPAEQREAWLAMPGFAKTSYGVAAATGFLGAIALLLRKVFARLLFIISLVAVIIQFGWVFGIYGGLGKLGASAAIFPLVIVIICIVQIWFAESARRRGWLH